MGAAAQSLNHKRALKKRAALPVLVIVELEAYVEHGEGDLPLHAEHQGQVLGLGAVEDRADLRPHG